MENLLLSLLMASTPDDVAETASVEVRKHYLDSCHTSLRMSCHRVCLLVLFEMKFLLLHGWRSVEDEIRIHSWTQQLDCLVTGDVK